MEVWLAGAAALIVLFIVINFFSPVPETFVERGLRHDPFVDL